MKSLRALIAIAALTSIGAFWTPVAQAQGGTWDKKTILTFNQPIEVPGRVLPAGTYVFRLLNLESTRHVVEIYQADGIHLITTCLAINDVRTKPTDKTVVTFKETSSDSPEALKTWFYPGDDFGQEFVYPKKRALEIAAVQTEPVPAIATDTTVAELPTAPVVDVAADQSETPVETAPPVVETAPPVAAPALEATADNTPEVAALPKTASLTPFFGLLGLCFLGLAVTLRRTLMS